MQKPAPPKAHRPRGPKPQFSRDEILDAAIALIDEQGLAAFSLRSLAGELSVTAMALYRYFDDKDALLDAVAARVLEEAVSRGPADVRWDVELTRVLSTMHDSLAEHPGVMELITTRYVAGPVDEFRDRLFHIVERAGWDERTTADALRAVTSYVLGSIMVTHRRQRRPHAGESPSSFGFGLALMIDALRASAPKGRTR